MSASFECDLSKKRKPLPHFWENTVGSGHAPLALRADWQRQMARCQRELGFRHVRFHGLLCDDMGTLICHRNEPLYSFFNADQVIEFLLDHGMRPFVELSFMPRMLASGDETVFHYNANVTPPRKMEDWNELIQPLVTHWVHRYGPREVSRWFFEVWNEPNMPHFWTGSQEEYFQLYCATARTIKQIDGALQVGGPATAKNEWISAFIDFCRRESAPVDFISTHHYPTDAFGSEDDDTVTQLAKSRRSVLREEARSVVEQAQGLPVYYTEWNTSSNPRDPLHDEPYAAAFIVKTILEAAGLVSGYSFWTFTDIFEENYFPSRPFHGGFGLLNLYGIAKPSFRAFELLHALGDETWEIRGEHQTVDVWAASRPRGATIIITNWALPRHEIDAEDITIVLRNSPLPRAVWLSRIDDLHANAKAAWQSLGSPDYLSEKDLRHLHDASSIAAAAHHWSQADGSVSITLSVPPQAVASIDVDFASRPLNEVKEAAE
jgi:xylan 1,4-beta-xylosidase